MNDIVERLRALDAWALPDAKAVMHEAAAEIERLRAERDAAISLAERHMNEKHRAQRRAFEDWGALQQRIKTAEAERDRLRATLREIAADCEDALAMLSALRAERDRLREALGEMVTTFYDAGCHICGGDCASANPPVGGCPVGVIRRARAALGEDRT